MVTVSCPYCLALLAEMRSAIMEAGAIIMEAGAIIEDYRAQVRAGDLPKAHVREWWQNIRPRERLLMELTEAMPR
jgi:hypothetical protein